MSKLDIHARNAGLDILRFLAAASVMLYHYLFMNSIGAPNGNIDVFRFGVHGVDVFFIISGFVISLSIVDKTPLQFVLARITRLVPAFYVCCLFTLLFFTWNGHFAWSDFLSTLLANLTFMPTELGYKPADAVYWTLSFEVRFYFVVFLLLVTKLWGRWAIHVWLGLALFNEFYWHNGIMSTFGITYFIGFFGLGVLLAQVIRGPTSWLDGVFFLVAAALTWPRVIDNNAWLATQYGIHDPELLRALFAPTAVLLTLAFIKLPIPRGAGKAAAILGAISYPLYLIHITAGSIVHMTGLPSQHWLSAVLLAISIALGLSAVVALVIEPRVRPLLRASLERLGRFVVDLLMVARLRWQDIARKRASQEE